MIQTSKTEITELRRTLQGLEIGLGQGQLVQHPAQAIDVGLHALAQGQLVLIPKEYFLIGKATQKLY